MTVLFSVNRESGTLITVIRYLSFLIAVNRPQDPSLPPLWAGVVPLNSDVIVSNKQYDKSFLGLIIKKLFLKFAKLRNGIDCSFNLHFH